MTNPVYQAEEAATVDSTATEAAVAAAQPAPEQTAPVQDTAPVAEEQQATTGGYEEETADAEEESLFEEIDDEEAAEALEDALDMDEGDDSYELSSVLPKGQYVVRMQNMKPIVVRDRRTGKPVVRAWSWSGEVVFSTTQGKHMASSIRDSIYVMSNKGLSLSFGKSEAMRLFVAIVVAAEQAGESLSANAILNMKKNAEKAIRSGEEGYSRRDIMEDCEDVLMLVDVDIEKGTPKYPEPSNRINYRTISPVSETLLEVMDETAA